MKLLKRLAPFWLLLVLTLAGCGGAGTDANSTVKDQFSSPPNTLNTPEVTTSTGSVLSYNLTLSTTDSSGNGTTVGPNGTIIATATLKDSNGNAVANQLITFKSDSASPVTIGTVTAATDSNGKALVFLTAPDTISSTDVILDASTVVKTQPVSAISIFKILRGSGNVINFITTKTPTDPDGTLNTVAVVVEGVALPSPGKILLQLVPFEILDLNNNPRPRIPVTVSIYSSIGCPNVFIDSPVSENPRTQTVTTDDSGRGIFNIGVPLDMPGIGDKNACSVIYKAVGPDFMKPASTIYSYGGFIASIENKKP